MSSNDEPKDVQLDISEYEGHTPGPWVWAKYPETETLKWCLTRKRENSMGLYIPDTFCYLAKFQQPLEKWNIHAQNYKLIADAPLFLEEVKRLNALIHRDYDWLKSNYPKVFDEMMMSKLYGDLQVEMPNAFDEDDTCWLYHESGSDGTIDKFNPIED